MNKIQIKNLRAGDLYVGCDGDTHEVKRVHGPTRKDWNHTTVYFRDAHRATTMVATTMVEYISKTNLMNITNKTVTGERNVARRFRDLAIGERFNFKSTFIVPTDYETMTWEKTGNRKYRSTDGADEAKGRELSRIYGYKYVRRDHKVGTINVEIA